MELGRVSSHQESMTDHYRVICGCRAFGNPSYHVQALFAEHQGLHYASTETDSLSPRDNGVAASVTCQDDACSRLSIKVRPFLYTGYPKDPEQGSIAAQSLVQGHWPSVDRGPPSACCSH